MPPERVLRVTKWIGQVPVEGICNLCGRTFKVPMTALARATTAQENLQRQFAQHKCIKKEGPDR
jgi:hypothetical protein